MRDCKALTSADVDTIIEAARAEAQDKGWAVSIAVSIIVSTSALVSYCISRTRYAHIRILARDASG